MVNPPSPSPTAATAALPHTPTHLTTQPNFLSHFISGLSSGFFSAALLQPADLLKTRVQQSHPPTTVSKAFLSILRGPNPVLELWRGTLPSVMRTSFGSGLYFSSLAQLRTFLATEKQKRHAAHQHVKGQHSSVLVQLSPTANLLSGAFSRAAVGFVVMPITILKVRFESDLYSYKSLYHATKSIFKNEGVAGFFRGWGATAARDAPYAGFYMLFYESGKTLLSRFVSANGENEMRERETVFVNGVSSAVAGGMAVALTNPFDTLKTRLQVLPGKYTNMWSASIRILREEGVRKLFDGLGIRMARKAVSSSVVWTGYEWIIGKRRKGKGDEVMKEKVEN